MSGGAGTDTLKLFGGAALPTMTGIEVLYIKGQAGDLNVSSVTDLTSVELDEFSLAAARTVNLNTGSSLTLTNTTGTANAITLSNNTATSLTINVSGSGDKTNAIDLDVDGDAVATLSLVAGTTASFVNVANTGAALTTLNVSGAGDLTIENVASATAINITSTGKTVVDTAVATVVVTGGAGAETVTLDHATGTGREFSVSTGAGDDTISFGTMAALADLTDSKVTISGGDGTDTLAMISAMGAVLSGASAAAFALKGIANDFEVIEITDQAATTDALGLARVGSNVAKVDYSAGLGAAQTLTGLKSGGTVVFGAAANATSDRLTVTVLDSAAAGAINDVLNITLDGAHTTTTLDYASLTAANVETININSTSTKATALVTANTNTFDGIFANATTINVTGNVAAVINADPFDGVVQVFNAAGNTAGVTVSFAANSNAVSITTTAVADTIVGGDAADVIIAGAGVDTITGGLGADTVTTGAGADKVVITGGITMDTITDFTVGTGGDIIQLDISLLETQNLTIAGTTTINFESFAAGTTGADVTTATTNKIATISTDATDATAVEGADIIFLAGATYATVAAALDAMESAGNRTITHTTNFAQDDGFFFVYSNSTTGALTLAAANVSAADDHSAGTAAFSAALLEGADLVSLTGVTDISTLVLANFDIV